MTNGKNSVTIIKFDITDVGMPCGFMISGTPSRKKLLLSLHCKTCKTCGNKTLNSDKIINACSEKIYNRVVNQREYIKDGKTDSGKVKVESVLIK